MRIYCAGPFFNPRQVEIANKIADLLRKSGFEAFAPVEEKFMEGGRLDAKMIFDRNIEWLDKSDAVFAQMDYPLDNGHDSVLPDSGTVWEMGYAFAKKIPVIGYTWEHKEKINLMLAQSIMGIFDFSNMENRFPDVFDNGVIKFKGLKPYQGRQI